MKKQTWEGLAHAHQTFYDETGIEISLAIDRALKKILTDHDRELVEGLEKMKKKKHCILHKKNFVLCQSCERYVIKNKAISDAQEFIKKGKI